MSEIYTGNHLQEDRLKGHRHGDLSASFNKMGLPYLADGIWILFSGRKLPSGAQENSLHHEKAKV